MIRAATTGDFAVLTGATGYVPPSNARGLVSEVEGRVLGLVVLDTWTPNSAHIHVLVRATIACRHLLQAALTYAFQHVGVLLGVVRAANAQSMRLAQRSGFREVQRVADGWQKGEDLIVFEMRREECRWIERAT